MRNSDSYHANDAATGTSYMNHRMANEAKNTAVPYQPTSSMYNKTTQPQGQSYGQVQGQGQGQGIYTYSLAELIKCGDE